MPGIVSKMKPPKHEALPRYIGRCIPVNVRLKNADSIGTRNPITINTAFTGMPLPDTSLSLLSRLRDEGDHAGWQVSWKRFLELYHGPLMAMAAGYRQNEIGEKQPEFRRIVENVEKRILKEGKNK